MAEQERTGPRIALVLGPGEAGGFPAAALLAGALHEGWDAHVIGDSSGELPGADLADLPAEVFGARVHPAPAGLRGRSRTDAAIALARSLRRTPAVGLRTIRPGAGPPRRLLRALAIELAPQLLHFSSPRVAHDWIGLARRTGARMLVSVGSDEAAAAALDFPALYSRVCAVADGLVVESDAVAALLHQHGVANGPSAASVIPPGADQDLLARGLSPRARSGPLRILSVGPLTWAHGYEHAIGAVRLLRDRGIPCEYRIVGRGEHLDAVAFATHQLGVDECVELVEPGTPDQLRAHFCWAQTLVNVAVLATSPKSVLDAQAAGVPVVSSEPPDGDADSVLVVPPLDPERLADALARLVEDGALYDRLVSDGRKRALRAPSPATQASRFLELYRRLLAHA